MEFVQLHVINVYEFKEITELKVFMYIRTINKDYSL